MDQHEILEGAVIIVTDIDRWILNEEPNIHFNAYDICFVLPEETKEVRIRMDKILN